MLVFDRMSSNSRGLAVRSAAVTEEDQADEDCADVVPQVKATQGTLAFSVKEEEERR